MQQRGDQSYITLANIIFHIPKETNTFLRGGTFFTAVAEALLVALFSGWGGGLIVCAGVYPRFELKPAATKVCWPATFTRNSWAISWDFCKMPKHCGLIPQLKVQNRYGVASNDAWKMRAVSKTRQLQCMLVKAIVHCGVQEMTQALWARGASMTAAVSTPKPRHVLSEKLPVCFNTPHTRSDTHWNECYTTLKVVCSALPWTRCMSVMTRKMCLAQCIPDVSEANFEDQKKPLLRVKETCQVGNVRQSVILFFILAK